MLENEIKLMLHSLAHNKKAFKTFYKTGFFSYANDKSYIGEAAIVNNIALISFLKDAKDETKIIATATFKNGYTVVLKLSNEDFSQYRFGKAPLAHEDIGGAVSSSSQGRDAVMADISSIIQHCAEAKEISASHVPFKINSWLRWLNFSRDQLSQKELKDMLENTLGKLNKAQNLSKRGKLSPSVSSYDMLDIPTSTSSISQTPNHYDPPR